jgi:drug/metabolite transporter (DMT)-like permease
MTTYDTFNAGSLRIPAREDRRDVRLLTGRLGGAVRKGLRLRYSQRAMAVLALVAANAIWGSTLVATKPLLGSVSPLTLAALRFAVAVAVLWPLVLLAGRRPALGRLPALMGFLGVFLAYLCQNLGLERTSAANAALIQGGVPVLTALLAAAAIGERPTASILAASVLSLAGVAAVVLLGGGKLGIAAFGDSLVLASGLAMAAFLVVGRRVFASGDPLAVVAGVAFYGLLFLLPASAAELALGGEMRLEGRDLLGLLYLGAGASGLAFVLWAYGLRHLEAGRAAVFVNLTPLVGVTLAIVALGEPLSAFHIVGAVLILAGVWITARPSAAGPATERSRSNSKRELAT